MGDGVHIIDRIDADGDVERIIPGHGPVGGAMELADQREYLDFMITKTRAAYDDGLDQQQAAAAIDLGEWGRWPEAERKEMNIAQRYATFAAEGSAPG